MLSENLFSGCIVGIPYLPTFCSCGLVAVGTVDGEENMDEKTREVTSNRMYLFC